MPVSYILKPEHGSNKPDAIDCTITIPQKDVSYTVKVETAEGVSRRIYVLKPKIDKITLLFDGFTADEKDSFPAWLWDLSKDTDHPQWTNAPKTSLAPKYKTNIVFRTATGKPVLIQLDPKGKPKGKKPPAFLRLEFNPAKLGPEGMAELKDAVGLIFAFHITFAKFLASSRVSRVDVACDLLNVATDELVARSWMGGKSHVYHGKSGKLETSYFALGKNKASTQTIYNKGRQLSETGRQKKFPGIAHTRVERRVNTNIAVAKLSAIDNPFKSFDVRLPVSSDAPEDPYIWALFLDSCRFRGIDAALEQLPEHLRVPYKQALDATKDTLWKPDKIWEAWPQILAESELL